MSFEYLRKQKVLFSSWSCESEKTECLSLSWKSQTHLSPASASVWWTSATTDTPCNTQQHPNDNCSDRLQLRSSGTSCAVCSTPPKLCTEPPGHTCHLQLLLWTQLCTNNTQHNQSAMYGISNSFKYKHAPETDASTIRENYNIVTIRNCKKCQIHDRMITVAVHEISLAVNCKKNSWQAFNKCNPHPLSSYINVTKYFVSIIIGRTES